MAAQKKQPVSTFTPHHAGDRVTLYAGDCLDVLRELDDASVDAVVTDPPYGLSATDPKHVVETLTQWLSGNRAFTPSVGGGFMGKTWDEFVPPPAVWDECNRVLKPGGHLLAFAGTRTHDLMSLSIRLAGFDKRDSIAWLYGSGFPKSLDVSKAIDKRRDWSLVERLSGEIRRAREASGMTLAEIGRATLAATDGVYGKWYHRGGHMFFETGRSLPSRPEWEQFRHVLPIASEFADVYDEAERAVLSSSTASRTDDGSWAGQVASGMFQSGERTVDITAPATDDARTWQGFGTALKPAFEPVVVARKPLTGTVASNVLTHGTGALNIDGCRIGDGKDRASGGGVGIAQAVEVGPVGLAHRPERPSGGRWPANVVLDESQAAALDTMTGELTSGANPTRRGADGERTAYGEFGGQDDANPQRGTDVGGASRFFYTAKAPGAERVKLGGVAHPTVKPLDLMRWLVRLVTPPGGIVLEPFAGSGTTVEACLLEGFRCVAIEREPDYLPLIMQRVNRRVDPVAAVKAANPGDAGLFDLIDECPVAVDDADGQYAIPADAFGGTQ